MPISNSIAHRLEQLILDGTFVPEQKIPSERRLAERLGVSRSIIREALHELQGRGLIKTKQGSGSFVCKIIAEPSIESPLLQLFFGHPRTLYDLFEVREQLEGQAAYLAAKRGNKKDEFLITKAYEAMEADESNSNAELDHAFHKSIVEASHNPVLVHILSSVKELLLHSVRASVVNLNPREEFKNQIDKHHRQIYNAIIAKQPQWAEKAAKAHVRHVSKSLSLIEKSEKSIIRSPIGEKTA